MKVLDLYNNGEQNGRVYSIDGDSTTLNISIVPKILINESNNTTGKGLCEHTKNGGGGMSIDKKHSFDMVIVKSNTNQVLSEGDSIDLKSVKSSTRGGAVKKGVVGALDHNCNQGVIQVNPSTESGGKQPYQQNRIYDSNGISPALNSQLTDPMKVVDGSVVTQRIRRLTEVECERLQGLPDDWTKYGMYPNKPVTAEERLFKRKCPKFFELHQILSGNVHKVKISATQRYRLCGNGVSIHAVLAVAKPLKENNYNS